MQKDRYVPPHSGVSLLANDLGQFFIAKIINIRLKLDSITPSVYPDLISVPGDIALSVFRRQTTEAVRAMITSGKKKILYPEPNTCDCHNQYGYICNMSLQIGYFAEA